MGPNDRKPAGIIIGGIMGVSLAWIDLHPFRLERFANDEWQRPWSADEHTFSSDFGHGL